MRAIHNQESDPFSKAKKKGKRRTPDVRSAAFAAGNGRRNARQLPTRQLNRGR
ncbi:hypothetical protein [Actinomadura fibrosa]|uniref:Uncharacterized protein n=1 Tax=Actinomadura fibrosa TaxID=111802 RepID=A0ABW2XDK4_9ACTN|nr:hypothetical protein [Actinomadura fibrosa]